LYDDLRRREFGNTSQVAFRNATPPATNNTIASNNTTGGYRNENVISPRIMSVVVLCWHQAFEFLAVQRLSGCRDDIVIVVQAARDHDFLADGLAEFDSLPPKRIFARADVNHAPPLPSHSTAERAIDSRSSDAPAGTSTTTD